MPSVRYRKSPKLSLIPSPFFFLDYVTPDSMALYFLFLLHIFTHTSLIIVFFFPFKIYRYVNSHLSWRESKEKGNVSPSGNQFHDHLFRALLKSNLFTLRKSLISLYKLITTLKKRIYLLREEK